MKKIKFGTKSETLSSLELIIKSARVLPQVRFDVGQWKNERASVWKMIKTAQFQSRNTIIRSSALNEDSSQASNAGKYKSIKNVKGKPSLEKAIDEVVASFDSTMEKNQIFIQPYLEKVKMSGVVFGIEPNSGANYIVINYDDVSGLTNTVTSGNSNNLKVFYHFKNSPGPANPFLLKIVRLMLELESIFSTNRLDVEFAIGSDNSLYVLQVRPLATLSSSQVSYNLHKKALGEIQIKFNQLNKPHPYLYGQKTVFAVMPDWNPAEIIGTRPRPLALSLYRELVTDSIWAYQRNNYGYKNMRSFPLVVSFGGLPYVDARISFNSFIPAGIEDNLSERLANYYIQVLTDSPRYHDKVEFEIVYSCYTLDLPDRLKKLLKFGFSKKDIQNLAESLRNLTNKIIHSEEGFWKRDIIKNSKLEPRRQKIIDSNLDNVSKIYWLLENCKRYGTLPFAGLARAGFIAVQMLQSLVHIGILSQEDYGSFMGSLNTVSTEMSNDFVVLSKLGFLKKYGHLRPGTYDIMSPRYDENPDFFFNWENKKSGVKKNEAAFVLSMNQLKKTEEFLKAHNLEHNALGLFSFIKEAIEGREYSKFIFTKCLSDALSLYKSIFNENGFSLEDCSYSSIQTIYKLYSSTGNLKEELRKSIEEGKERYEITKNLTLPPVLTHDKNIWSFELPLSEPNFITLKIIQGNTVLFDKNKVKNYKDCILLIESADPGYDWIFSKGIKGFITKYGGANSHMAIRSGELGVPAIIGAGEVNYSIWSKSRFLSLDCANKKVSILG
ncbi:MAG: PEP/pyruvate-binding domain-containing protein [Elusimicrobiota bacterium]